MNPQLKAVRRELDRDAARCVSTISRTHKAFSRIAQCSVLILLLAAFAVPCHAQWTSVWSDEFDGPAGSLPNPANWTYDVGNNHGWGNAELEVYCPAGSRTAPCDASKPNVFMDGNGNLVIRAIRNQQGVWTSTRMKTEGLQNFQYGRMEARIKLTVGNGLWPAFWMLGSDIAATPPVPWPACGEQDIMEWVDFYTPNSTSSTVHGPGYSGGNGIGNRFFFPDAGRIDDASFHTYGVVWSPYEMQFYRDDWTQPFLTVTPTSIPLGSSWVYNNLFFILLNQAVGGSWFPGPDATTPSPADMVVDYVRVMQWNEGPPASPRNLRALSNASNQVELKWEAGHGGDVNGNSVQNGDEGLAYDIYASTTPDFTPSFSNLVVQNFHGTRYIHQGLNPSTTYYYRVLAASLGGESDPNDKDSNQASATTEPFGSGRGISMNAGGYAVEQFATENFSAGGFTNNHTNLTIDTSGVQNPAPQGVYQTEHWGASDWAIPNLNPQATYLLRLHFVENTFSAAGKRIFNVVVNGQQVLTNFDIYATTGAMSKAVVESFIVTPDENGIVSLQFVQGPVDQPTISGIELLNKDDDNPDLASATVVTSGSGGTTATLGINAGGPQVGTFVADTDFAGGKVGSVSAPADTSAVNNPAPAQVYVTQRVGQPTGPGSFGYFIPNLIPGATYRVRLHFDEGFFSTANSRVFNVTIDGQPVLRNFDIIAAAGKKNKAVIEEFSVKADQYGLIMIDFLPGAVNVPSVRGIELLETAPPPPPAPPDNDD